MSKQGIIVNPATGRPFLDAPQPVWITEKSDPHVRSLCMVQGGEIICLLAVVRLTEGGAGEYKLVATGEHGTEEDVDKAMLKVQEIITHHTEGRVC